MYRKINAEYPTTSCTIAHGVQISIQAKYESIKSTVVPDTAQARQLGFRSEYFFVLKFNLKVIGDEASLPKESYRLKKMKL